jgi:hypothetical protein
MKQFALICLLSLTAISAIAQNNPVPFLTQPLWPTSVPPGHAAFTLKIGGAGFRSGAVVNWNGSRRATTFVSQNEVEAEIPATDVVNKTVAAITVSNPAPGGGTSNIEYFAVGPAFGAVSFARRDTPIRSPLGPNSFPTDPVVADFNNDGKLDLVVAWATEWRSIIQIFPGNGDGTFGPPVETDVPFTVTSLVAGDFNGDGNQDIALARPIRCGGCNFTPYLYVFLGTGDGHLNMAPGGEEIEGEPIAAADFNGDCKLDLIITYTDHNIDAWYPSVTLSNGDGTFGTPTLLEDQELFSIPQIGDFNDDGVLDVTMTPCWYSCFGGGEVDVFFGTGDGSFQPPVSNQTPARSSGVAVGDVNRDGNLDIVTGDYDVLLGNGEGDFTVQSGNYPMNASGLQLVDINNDGNLDLLSLVDGGFAVFLGNGDGTFQAPQSSSSGNPAIPETNPVVVGFPKDGRLALVDLNTDALSGEWVISTFRQTSLSVTPTFYDFPTIGQGSKTGPQSFTVTNIGTWPVTVSAIQLSGSVNDYSENDSCVGILAAGASCTVNVTFAPQQVSTFLPLQVGIVYTGTTGSPQYIEIEGASVPGTGLAPPPLN